MAGNPHRERRQQMKPINMHDSARSHDQRTREIEEQATLVCDRLIDRNKTGERITETYCDGRIRIRATHEHLPTIISVLINGDWAQVYHGHRDFVTRYRPGFWEFYLTTLYQKATAIPGPEARLVWQTPAEPLWDRIDDGNAFMPADALFEVAA